MFETHFNSQWLNNLLTRPEQPYQGEYGNQRYAAQIAIPHYRERLLKHYSDILHGDINRFCLQAEIPAFEFEHYGVIIHFEQPTILTLHDFDMELNSGLKELIKKAGAVIIKNAYMNLEFRNRGHRNRFPQLNFHIDRSSAHPTHYSMYSRDPFDDEQKFPRTSSTLFIPSIVGHLQAIREQLIRPDEKGLKNTYTLFTQENMAELSNNIILEHRWIEPEGTGELSMLDNLTALHASYYPNPAAKGYKIGVRYLS